MNARTMSPLIVPAWVLVMFLIRRAWPAFGVIPRGLAAGYLALILVAYVHRLPAVLTELRLDGQGYASRHFSESEIIPAARQLPDVPIYTNSIAVLYFHVGRNPFTIPWKLQPDSLEIRPGYAEELATMRRRMREEGAVIVLYRPEGLLPDQAPLEELLEGNVILETFGDGLIVKAPEASDLPAAQRPRGSVWPPRETTRHEPRDTIRSLSQLWDELGLRS